MTQRIIGEDTNISFGTVNGLISRFLNEGLINEIYQTTTKGYEDMEPFRFQNAIIIAADMSTRFIPVSYELPKGLISVKSEDMIKREIKQLLEADIQEIVIVVGYR